MRRFKTAAAFFDAQTRWQAELRILREILLSTGLTEEIKWSAPCYTAHGKNVVGVAGFKEHFTLWFHQGALLADKEKVLVNAQEGRTKALRQWRMTSAKDIKKAAIKAYVKEAIVLAREGKAVPADRGKALVMPPELAKALKGLPKAGTAFKAMTPGRQREYAEYVAEAKQAQTKARRIEKILPLIAAGKGLNDKYR